MASLVDGVPASLALAQKPNLLEGLESFQVDAGMSTETLGRAVVQAERIAAACADPLHGKLNLFLKNLIGPSDYPNGDFSIDDDCQVLVLDGKVVVRSLYAPQNVRSTREFSACDCNLFGILCANTNLVDDFFKLSGACVNFTVPLERFNRIVAGGPDERRDAYPLLVDETCDAVGVEVEDTLR